MSTMTTPARISFDPSRTVLLRGRDVVPWLQTKLTCDTRRFSLSGGGYGFATDINGRVLFDAHVRVLDRAALLIVPPGAVDSVRAHVEKYVIMEDVAAEPGAAMRAIFVVDVLPAQLGLDPLEPGAAELEAVKVWQGRGTCGGLDGTWIVCADDDAPRIEAALDARGWAPVDEATLATDEIARGFPRAGRDIVLGETIPVEAGAWHGIATNKGCYLGQEVIERLISRGNPARRLVRLRWAGPTVAPSTPIAAQGEDAGVVTSCVADSQGTIGMGFVRRRFLDAPEGLEVAGNPVEVLGLVETAPAPTR